MKKALILGLILGLAFSFIVCAEDYHCLEHGELEEDEVVIIKWNNDYYICKECAMNLILNNAEQIGLMMKEAREKGN